MNNIESISHSFLMSNNIHNNFLEWLTVSIEELYNAKNLFKGFKKFLKPEIIRGIVCIINDDIEFPFRLSFSYSLSDGDTTATFYAIYHCEDE